MNKSQETKIEQFDRLPTESDKIRYVLSDIVKELKSLNDTLTEIHEELHEFTNRGPRF